MLEGQESHHSHGLYNIKIHSTNPYNCYASVGALWQNNFGLLTHTTLLVDLAFLGVAEEHGPSAAVCMTYNMKEGTNLEHICCFVVQTSASWETLVVEV